MAAVIRAVSAHRNVTAARREMKHNSTVNADRHSSTMNAVNTRCHCCIHEESTTNIVSGIFLKREDRAPVNNERRPLRNEEEELRNTMWKRIKLAVRQKFRRIRETVCRIANCCRNQAPRREVLVNERSERELPTPDSGAVLDTRGCEMPIPLS